MRISIIGLFSMILVSALLISPLAVMVGKKSYVLAAQTTTGSLVGTIVDQQNNPIEGAEVTVTNRATGFKFGKQRTDAAGIYRVDFVPPGEYDITAEKIGFQPNTLANFLVELNRTRVLKVPPIPLVPQNVAPPPPPNIVNTVANVADATLRGSASEEFIRALPLAGIRSFDTFALLVPGVAPAPATYGANGPGLGPGVGTAGQFSINGQRARANNFTIDGSDNNDQDVGVRRQGFTSTIPQPVESIKEFQISTLLADSEAGRNIGGQVNVVTRSGANEIHGEVYDLFNDSALNARDFFDVRPTGQGFDGQDSLTRNQLGGSIGLPVIKDRLHLFAAAEQQNIDGTDKIHFAVPTISERGDAFSLAGRNRFGRDLLDLYPLPNNGGGPYGQHTFTKALDASGRGTLFSIKVDYQFPLLGKPSTFSSRYNFTDDDTRIAAVGGAINSSITALTRTQNLAFTLDTIIANGKSNQVRFSCGRTALGFEEVTGSPFIFQTRPVRDENGDGIPDGLSGPIGRLALSPFSSIGVDPFTFPQGRANNTFQIADTFIYTRGRNTLKFGADIRRVQFNSFLDRNYRTQIAFNPNLLVTSNGLKLGTGVTLAGLGLPSDITQALAVTPDSTLGLRFTELSLFAHDNLRIHPRVSLTAGIRYERNSVPTDVNRRIERTLAIQPADLGITNPGGFVDVFLDSFNAQRQFINGRKRIYEADNNNFAPRVGVAIDLTGDGRTSLRAGYGLFYDQILGNIVSQSRNIFPGFIPVNFGTTQPFPGVLTSNPAFIGVGVDGNIPLVQPGTLNTIGTIGAELFPGLGQLLGGESFALAFTLPDKNIRTPYVHQYSLTVERTILDQYLVSVSYVGTLGRKLIRFRAPNGGSNSPLLIDLTTPFPLIEPIFTTDKRPFSSLGALTIFDSSAKSNYNALQVSLVRRSLNGLGFQLAYTYSHAIDEVSDIFDLSGAFSFAQDEMERDQGLRAERGDASFDVRHRFTAGWQYDLPSFGNNRLLGGFQLSGIVTLQTGQPFTVNSSLDVNYDGNLTDRLNSVEGLIVSDRGRTRIALAPGRSALDLLAITEPSRRALNGSIGRNTFRAAGIATVDLALAKNFAFSPSRQLGVRVEAFNLFNRTHFGIPVRILEAPAFGSSVNTTVPARIVQAVVRFSF